MTLPDTQTFAETPRAISQTRCVWGHMGGELPWQVRYQQQNFTRRRQTALCLVYNPKIEMMLFVLPQEAEDDGRFNMGPVQGPVEHLENPTDACIRIMKEELGYTVPSAVPRYIGSLLLPAPDRKLPQWNEQNFHSFMVVTEETNFMDGIRSDCSPSWVLATQRQSMVMDMASNTKKVLMQEACKAAVIEKLLPWQWGR